MSRETRSVLLVSNEPSETRELRGFLASRGFGVHVTTGSGAVQALAFRAYELVIVDVGCAGVDGVGLTRRTLELDQESRVLLIAHPGATHQLVEALRLGAFDYISTPIVEEELERKIAALGEVDPFASDDSTIVAESQVMKTVFSRAARACGVDLPVFLHGELGTGRKTIARAIHRFGSSRNEPFLVMNLKIIPPHLMATELFGTHPLPVDDGAHFGILGAAGRGAVFLENIDAMTSGVQLKLIGVLDTGMIHPLGPSLDARLFCSAERDLDVLVSQGLFQSGLHYRLSALRIAVPPLHERPEDIAALATHFLQRYSERSRKTVLGISPDALAVLTHYSWPGNIRELANVMERAFVLANDRVELSHLPARVTGVTLPAHPKGPFPDQTL